MSCLGSSDSVNKFPVPAHNFVMSRLFKLAAFCGDLRVEAAMERGAAVALQGQLVETRQEMASLQARGMGGRPRRRGESGAPDPRRDHEHPAFLTHSVQTTPARDVLWLLKTNIHPASKDITDIVLRHTRYDLTVFSYKNDAIQNLVQANAVTRASISIRVPSVRKPHIRLSAVDRDVDQDTFFNILKERKTGLEIDEKRCTVRVSFRKRSGTNAFIGQVDPYSFKALMSRTHLSLGWTVLQVFEDLHVPTCTFCATYGHGRSSCPH
ncbi:hypothetical protein MRX96_020745 [Rhipicephalus microplus]